jgi:DNA-binding Lrp family transcriptional regulator
MMASYSITIGGADMVVAFVLLKVGRGSEISATDKIKKLPGVLDVAALYGEYDAVVKVEKKNMEELQSFLVKEIRQIDGVAKTSTLIANN